MTVSGPGLVTAETVAPRPASRADLVQKAVGQACDLGEDTADSGDPQPVVSCEAARHCPRPTQPEAGGREPRVQPPEVCGAPPRREGSSSALEGTWPARGGSGRV